MQVYTAAVQPQSKPSWMEKPISNMMSHLSLLRSMLTALTGWLVNRAVLYKSTNNIVNRTKRGAVFSIKAIFLISSFVFYCVSFFVSWQCKADGTMVNICTDTKRVGQSISTKAVGSNTRLDITDSYKYKEGGFT